MLQNSWIELSTSALNHNIAQYRSLVPAHLQLGAVVKGNGYGHGMREIAQMLEQHAAISWLFTASISEALLLRAQGIQKPIAALSYHDAPLTEAIKNHIDLVIVDERSAHAVSQAAQTINLPAYVHLKIDTGLSRLGIRVSENPARVIEASTHIAQLPGITIRAIFSHFADVESSDHSFAQQQQELFDLVVRTIHHNALVHMSCTAALGSRSLQKYHLARFGIGLYGLWPSRENRQLLEQQHISLQPVLTWKSRIIQLKDLPTQSSVGYDRTFITQRPATIAVIPVGYADGLDRQLSNKGHVLIRGHQAPIVGRVSMNVTIIDVTDVPDIDINDEVIIMGDHPAVHADTIAAHCNTINYDIVTRISPFLQRNIVP